MDGTAHTEADSVVRLHRPAWLLVIDWGLPSWLLAASVAAAATAAEPAWRRIALACLLGLPGLGLLIMAGQRALSRRFDAAGLDTRTLLGGRSLSAGDIAKVTEHRAFRNPIGTVRSLTLVATGGSREVIESTEVGYHLLRERLVTEGLLGEEPAVEVVQPVEPFEIRPTGMEASGLALVAFFLLGAAGAAGAGAALLGGWPAVLLAPLAGIALLLAWAALGSCTEALVRYEVADGGFARIAPWGRTRVGPADIAGASERWQANGGDRNLVIELANGRRWKLDSICAGYPELIAWLDSRGVEVQAPNT